MTGWPWTKPPKPPDPPAPSARLIQVIVRDTINANVNGARVTLTVPVMGTTIATTTYGLANLMIPSTLADTQLGVYAEGFKDVDTHLVVSGINQVWVGGGVPGTGILCLPPMQAVARP